MTATEVSAAPPTYAEYQRRNRRLLRDRMVIQSIIAIAFGWAVWGTSFGILTLFQGMTASVEFIVTDMLPPRLDAVPDLIEPALETLYMSYVAVAMSIVLSIPLGVLAARNTTVHVVVAYLAKAVTAFVRAVPSLVIALFLVAAFGLGPLAGTFALGVGGVGILAKAYADGIEAIDMQQVEGTRATGGSRLQILGQGVWPQFKPSFVTWSLYRLDLNIRAAAIMGLVGAGGLGFSLSNALRLFQFRTATTIILMLLFLIVLVEAVNGALRKRAL